ncbi:MAG: hypothetical protein DRP47_07935 [Candidatus Zixiibacteriota bacterium]|nr:MAG: hypothetical protein DRP47_07935 [candidate division Zixibacteria bacterium]
MNKLITQIYDLCPASLQNLAITLYGLKIYRREYGKKLDQQLALFDQQARFSPEEIRNYQSEKLRLIINHAYEYVPYYRRVMDKRKLKPADFRSVDDLYKMPVLPREEVKKHGASMISTAFKRSRLIGGHTSGTTGSPLSFYYDNHSCLIKTVVDWRQKRWAGINVGDKIAFFLGRVVVPVSRANPPFWRKNILLNHLFFSSFHMSKENMKAYADQLFKFRPQAVEGYPSTIYIIASYLLSQNRTYPAKAVFTSSETLYPQQRETIEEAFECRLFDFYGAAERVIFATECDRHRGKHLNLDYGITEILGANQEPAKPGELGRMVSTGLHNLAMPLIRYRTDDVSSLSTDLCPCGCTFPLMADVTTKAEDIITTLDGRYISSSILTHPFKPLQGVAESQIIQEDRGHIIVKIIKTPDYRERNTEYLIGELKNRIGKDMTVEIEFVDLIPRTKAGKFRWVISKVPLEF